MYSRHFIWVKNVLNDIFKLKMFLFCSNQVELAVFKYKNKLLVQSLVYTYQKVVK